MILYFPKKEMLMADLLKKLLPFQSEFSHRYACWANNHNGWAKMKKANKSWLRCGSKEKLKKKCRRKLIIMYVNPVPMIDVGKEFVMEVNLKLQELTDVEIAKDFLADYIKNLPKSDLVKLIRCKSIKAVYPED